MSGVTGSSEAIGCCIASACKDLQFLKLAASFTLPQASLYWLLAAKHTEDLRSDVHTGNTAEQELP